VTYTQTLFPPGHQGFYSGSTCLYQEADSLLHVGVFCKSPAIHVILKGLKGLKSLVSLLPAGVVNCACWWGYGCKNMVYCLPFLQSPPGVQWFLGIWVPQDATGWQEICSGRTLKHLVFTGAWHDFFLRRENFLWTLVEKMLYCQRWLCRYLTCTICYNMPWKRLSHINVLGTNFCCNLLLFSSKFSTCVAIFVFCAIQ
jgi:hypothetical protein